MMPTVHLMTPTQHARCGSSNQDDGDAPASWDVRDVTCTECRKGLDRPYAEPWDPRRLQGWQYLRTWRGAVYLRIPSDLARTMDDGRCKCDFCQAHPDRPCQWDTLGIDISNPNVHRRMTWTLHAPEWKATDKIDPNEAPRTFEEYTRQR